MRYVNYRSVVGAFEHRQHVVEEDDECGAGMSLDISKRWCGAGSTPYSLLHRLKCLLVLLRRQRIFAALARDSRELIVAHPFRIELPTHDFI